MSNVSSVKKQKLSLAKQYELYLNKGPKTNDELSNKYNLLDNLNAADETMMTEAKSYILKQHTTLSSSH